MKILKLSFENINSLAGKWNIDFTSDEYQTDGVFAITGPTGAGKSTILDAISLALYGRTPRLGSFNKENQVMTRKTFECFSEVIFECQSKIYRCKWSQKRSKPRKKTKNSEEVVIQDADELNLGKKEHEIGVLINGGISDGEYEILTSMVDGVKDEIVKITGMDFENFTRSVMLAQGSFTSFLTASDKDKAEILEKIIGGNEYSELSSYVYKRNSYEKNKLSNYEIELNNYQCLSEEDRKNLKEQIDLNKKSVDLLNQRIKSNAEQINLLNNVLICSSNLEKLLERKEILNKEIEDFAPKKIELEKANRASEVEPFKAKKDDLANRVNDYELRIKDNIDKIEVKKDEIETSKQKNAKIENELSEHKIEAEKEKVIAIEVRALDGEIDNTNKLLRDANNRCKLLEKELDQTKKKRSEAQKGIDKANKSFNNFKEEILAFTNGEDNLDLMLDKAEKAYQNLKSYMESENELISKARKLDNEISIIDNLLSQSKKSHESIACEIAKYEKKNIKTQKEIEKINKEFNAERIIVLPDSNGNESIDFYINSCSTELRQLQDMKVMAAKIKSLEAHRAELKPGEPCPLCGSLEHPYTLSVPAIDDSEERIGLLEKFIKKAQDINSKLIIKEEEIKNNLEYVSQYKNQEEAENLKIKENSEKLASFISDRKKLYGEKNPDAEYKRISNEVSTAEKEFVQIQKKREEYKAKEQETKQEIGKFEGSIKELTSEIDKNSVKLQEEVSKANEIEMRLKALKKERFDKYGDKNPDKEENRLSEAIKQSEKANESAKKELESLEKSYSNLVTLIDENTKNLTKLKIELGEANKTYVEKLSENGFSSEFEFKLSVMDKKERERLIKREKELDTEKNKNQGSISLAEKNLAESKQKVTTNKSLEELNEEQEQLTGQYDESNRNITIWEENLKYDAQNQSKYDDCQNRIKQQKSIVLRWEGLNSLIGSANGDNFRKFAQGIMFERVVYQANKYLSRILSRYELVQDEENPLVLNVKDYDQMGVIRPVKNLSGGETFVVCLSLALGLSSIASYKVAVNSMFLDEGFGSLDSFALEKALHALKSLNAEGKTIGIISHVGLVKERIGTQINVEPLGNGHSSISGPGVERLA